MRVNYQNQEVLLPDFLLVGAAKAGTTSIHHYLKQHNDIFMPIGRKESFFFTYANRPIIYNGKCQDYIVSDPAEYFSWFSQVQNEKYIGECSNIYLYRYDETIKNIKSIYGSAAKDLKIIIILRNPIERAFSMHQMLRNRGVEKLPFRKAILAETILKRREANYSPAYDYIGWGMYAAQVKAYMNEFPKTLILFSEELNVAAEKTMCRIYDFIGVTENSNIDYNVRYNVNGTYKNKMFQYVLEELPLLSPLKKIIRKSVGDQEFARFKFEIKKRITQKDAISDEGRRELQKVFSHDINQLESLLNVSLESWMK
jgi:hypothetical protein